MTTQNTAAEGQNSAHQVRRNIPGIRDYLAFFQRDRSYEQDLTNPQTVLTKLREFIKDLNSTSVLDRSTREAVQGELAKLVILLQKIENLLHKHRHNSSKHRELQSLVDDVDVALDALSQIKPHYDELHLNLCKNLAKTNVELARSLRIAIERIVNRYQYPHFWAWIAVNRFNDAYRSDSTPVKVLYGLIAALLVNVTLATAITGGLVVLQNHPGATQQARELREREFRVKSIQARLDLLARKNAPSQTYSQQRQETLNQKLITARTRLGLMKADQSRVLRNIKYVKQVILVLMAGTLGSIISILIRIEDFQDKRYRDPATPFLIGGFKPIIGASFSIFFFTLLSSELVQIPGINARFIVPSEQLEPEEIEVLSKIPTTNEGREACFIFAIAFLVGFSERLATDAISKMEDAVGGKPDDDEDNTRVIKRTQTETDTHRHVKEEAISETESASTTSREPSA